MNSLSTESLSTKFAKLTLLECLDNPPPSYLIRIKALRNKLREKNKHISDKQFNICFISRLFINDEGVTCYTVYLQLHAGENLFVKDMKSHQEKGIEKIKRKHLRL